MSFDILNEEISQSVFLNRLKSRENERFSLFFWKIFLLDNRRLSHLYFLSFA